MSNKRVAYFRNSDFCDFYFGEGHPMKPYRIAVTDNLVRNYNLYTKMQVYRPLDANADDMCKFHSTDYVNLLKTINLKNQNTFKASELAAYGFSNDCPVFDGIYQFCSLYTGGSLEAAVRLNNNQTDIAINWSGGFHHAKADRASGFCFINDIVIAIDELLKQHQRILYIDIDLHHADAVQEKYYNTDRVMTVSFHHFAKDFFPGTGNLYEIGTNSGRYYSLNIPFKANIDDHTYVSMFKYVIQQVMDFYRPCAIVLQCGADSVIGDKFEKFQLTIKGHGECVQFVRNFNLPLVILGGGGYSVGNTARCWVNETAILLDQELPNELPYTEYFAEFAPNLTLHCAYSSGINSNPMSTKDLHFMKEYVKMNLSMLPHAPSVQMHDSQHLPPVQTNEDKLSKDVRLNPEEMDEMIVPNNEWFESDQDMK